MALLILAFRPGPRHSQIVAKLMEIAHCGAVTHLETELLLEISMELDSRPVKLASLARVLLALALRDLVSVPVSPGVLAPQASS